MFLVARVWGGLADLIAGRVVDATNTRWGKFRPYLLFASAPLLLLNVAVFSIPSGLSTGGKLAFAYVSYIAFQLAYSFVNIPYGSLSAAMTQVPDERAKLSTARTICTTLAILLIAVVVSPQVSGGGDLQRSLTITTVIFAVVGFALYLFCFSTSRETVQRSDATVTLAETARMLGRNKPLLLLCAACLLFLGGQFSLQTVAVYYARDVLGNANLYIVLTVVTRSSRSWPPWRRPDSPVGGGRSAASWPVRSLPGPWVSGWHSPQRPRRSWASAATACSGSGWA